MRRKLLTYTLLAAIAGVVLWACQRDRFGQSDPNAVEPTLTVNEAQSIFESQMTKAIPALTKLPSDNPVGMMPGDFTPLWNKARIGANREMDGADVPIDPKFIFVAVFNKITPEGDTLRQTVDVTQKLVVKKWRDTTDYQAYSYIASIVPTPEHYAKNKNTAKEFRYAGSKGDFSGFVVYQTLEGLPAAIVNYRNGKPTRYDYFPQVTEQNADSVSLVMQQVIGPVAFQSGSLDDFEDDLEKYVAKEVTIKGHRPNNPWEVNIHIVFLGGGGSGGGGITPPPIDYNSPVYTGGGSSGGSGYIGLTGNPKIISPDCGGNQTRIKTETGNLFDILKHAPSNTNYNSPTFSDFTNRVNSQPNVEHSMVLKGYSDGTVMFGGIKDASGPDAFVNVENNANTIAVLHSHPNSHLTAPSALDVMNLAGQKADGNGQVQASYVIVGGEVYSLQITDVAKADAFYKSNSTMENGQFTPGTQAGKLWKEGSDRMESLNSNVSKNERDCAAMAYVLGRADAGITICRMAPGSSKFTAYGVKPNAKGEFFPTKCQ